VSRPRRILVFTHPEGEQRYRADVDAAAVRQRVEIPVREVPAGSHG
jgi:hypothetical protein